ncbi:MAG: hypothetical protein AB7S38_08545 [Vulcanimicrobiota bacterium]
MSYFFEERQLRRLTGEAVEVRGIVPRGLTDGELEAGLRRTVEEYARPQLCLQAYTEGDPIEGFFTAAQAKLHNGQLKITIADLYHQPSIYPCAPGDLVRIAAKPAEMSAQPGEWERPIAVVTPRAEVKVLEVRRYVAASDHQFFRIRVKVDGIVGWLHDFDLAFGPAFEHH